MAIALRAAQGSNNGAGAGTITMTVPAGITNGDVMVMVIGVAVTTISSTPSGWTSLQTQLAGISNYTYWRVASSEPASYSVSLSLSDKAAGVIIAFSGASSSTPGSSQYSVQSNLSSTTTISFAALGSFASSNGADIAIGTPAFGTTITPPASYTEPASGNSRTGVTSSDVTAEVGYRLLSAVTTVGTLSATAADASGSTAAHIFILEAGGSSGSIPALATWQNHHLLGTFVPENLSIEYDSSSIVNSYIVQGASNTNYGPFRNYASIAKFGEIQGYYSAPNADTANKALSAGLNALAQTSSPSARGSFEVREPIDGWKPGQWLLLTSPMLNQGVATAYKVTKIGWSYDNGQGKRHYLIEFGGNLMNAAAVLQGPSGRPTGVN